MKRIIFFLVFVVLARPSWGWGFVGHEIINEAATFGAPEPMPRFFHEAYPRLVWLGYQPDRWRGAGDSSDAFNAPNHYLDYEYVAHLELSPKRYEYVDLLYRSGTLDRYGIDSDDPGFLPWRIAELTELLEREWRIWSYDGLTAEQRKTVESSIIFLSGTLGHFVADAANPHHATIHYNGWALAPPPEGYATDCETHSRFETVFVTKAIDRADVFAILPATEKYEDYFEAALRLVKDSHELVDTIYELDARGSFDPEHGSVAGEKFAVSRLAAGAATLRNLWWSAYRNGTASRQKNE